MINSFIAGQIRANFGFEPTSEQASAIERLAEFLVSEQSKEAFLLRGFAGTGKTTLVGALVKTLDQLKQRVVLMAPTGRAAKVFSLYSGHTAHTIHRRIYRQKSLTDDTSFSLNENLARHTLFIVDEASMIGDDGTSVFGSGHLLDDLISFVYSGEGCRLLLMGDTAQLPPVGREESPALQPEVLEVYGLHVHEVQLTQVMRQKGLSGILENATTIRQRIEDLTAPNEHTDFDALLRPVRLRCCQDVIAIRGNLLIERITDTYDHVGDDDSIVICRTNKNANIYNRGIRATILYREEELSTGDRIMIVKNNYFWTEREAAVMAANQEPYNGPTFLANGDMGVVRRIHHERELYGFRFADVLLTFPDYDHFELEVTVLLDTLSSESPALTKPESERLFAAVMEDYADIPSKAERYKQLRQNPYFNALQIKSAYAVTCHKAQGGQWDTVFLDRGWLPPETVGTPEYYRWLYTAFTRATRRIYLVNWPADELDGDPEEE